MTADLRFARLTARGEAGLSVFRLRGRAVAGVLARIFRARGASRLEPGQVRVGSLLDGDAALDDVVVRIRAAPDGWEADISTHGSPYVGDRLAVLIAEAGGRPLADAEQEGLSGARESTPGTPSSPRRGRPCSAPSRTARRCSSFTRSTAG